MKSYIINNKQFLIIGLIWLFLGIYTGSVVYFALPVILLLMYWKGMHLEILIGFFFILTLSDSRLDQLGFAATIKNIYIIILSLISIKETRLLEYPIGIYKYFIGFFLIALICLFFSPNMGLSFQKTLSYILLFTCVPNYFLFVYKKHGVDFFKSIVFFTSLILLLGLVYNRVDPEITSLEGRYRGLLGNPNGLGLYTFLFVLFFAVVNDHYEKLFSNREKIIVYGLCFFSLLKCGARASLIATLMFFFFRKFYKMSPIFGFVVFLLTLFLYQLVSDNIAGIIVSLGLGEELRVESLQSGSGRLIAWQFAWEQIQQNFYFGKGFSYTEYIYHKYYEYLSRLGHEGAAHNSYLTFWLDTGLVGLISYIIGLIAMFVKAAKYSRLAIPILYSILFSNQYESWLTASLNPFTIQLLFILSIIFIQISNRIDSEEETTSSPADEALSA